jgi:hypothetical protein
MNRPLKHERTTLGSSEARHRAYYCRFLPAMQPTYHQKHTHRGKKAIDLARVLLGARPARTHERPTNNHCVGLPRPGLAVREDADVVAVECRP